MQVRKIATVLCLIFMMSILMMGCSDVKNDIADDRLEAEQSEDTTGQEENEITEEENQEAITEEENVDPEKVPSEEEQTDVDESREERIPITQAEFITEEEMQQKVRKRLKKDTVKTVYKESYQDAVSKIIESYKKKKEYTMDAPLFLLNPYGTMEQGLYVYYHSEEACKVGYSVYVDNEAIPEFQSDLVTSQEIETEHEGMFLGLMPGMKNYLMITETDAAGDLIDYKVFCVNLEKTKVTTQVLYAEGENNATKKLSEGVFWLLGSQDSQETGIPMVDENGVKRLVLTTDGPVNSDIEKVSEYLVYPKDQKTLVVLDRFGKADYLYSLGDYVYENDLRYSENTGCLYLIASDTTRDTKADVVLSVNLGNGDVKLVMDFAPLFSDNQETGLGLNSLDFFGDQQLLVSSAGLSSIFCIDEINGNPKIEYIIAGGHDWANTEYNSLNYQAIGSFDPFVNQSTIQVTTEDKRLIDGQYYITMQSSSVACDSYYKIFVDENTKTFTLAERKDLSTEQTGQSVQLYDNRLIWLLNQTIQIEDSESESGILKETVFYELDEEGDVLATYRCEESSFAISKVKKMSLSGMWKE